jgi:hypothetical protein
MCIIIPVLLLGTKYCVDLVSYHNALLYSGGGTDFYKKCAREAALAVAKHWNPGLTLKQQKETLLRIADDVYNKNPCYSTAPVHRAIPGLEIKGTSVTVGNPYDPLKVLLIHTDSCVPAKKEVAYGTVNKNLNNRSDRSVVQLFQNVFGSRRLSHLAIEDAFWIVGSYVSGNPTYGTNIEESSSGTAYSYTERTVPDDTKVQITVADDKICVQTDSDVDYAVPAECNVDIVLAIPTNAEAPVVEIAQGYRKFLADNFEFTRGVNVGLIPYSGKVSLPFDRNDWSKKITGFDPEEFLSSGIGPYCRGYFFYGAKGTADADLAGDYDDWGDVDTTVSGRPIMCGEDLLSKEEPKTDATRFRRANLQPCIVGYANLLSMKCERTCETYAANPFPVVELTADVGKMKDLLNVIVLPNDNYNKSNFIFIPAIWANNLFQSWTDDPVISAQNTVGSAVDDGGHLSRPSKIPPERKKALILIVNKPDWFEPNELTYLGFDNDYSEIPMIESDKIDFSINYSDTSRKFADGSSYNGTIAGSKKILKFETASENFGRNETSGFYETLTENQTVTAKLSFPNKYLIKIVVAPIDKDINLGKWRQVGSLASICSIPGWCMCGKGLGFHDGKWMAVNSGGYVAVSTDNGRTWTDLGQKLPSPLDSQYQVEWI